LFTFILDYKDLFYEKSGKYFFNIIFDKNNKNQWKLGKPFLKKYVFVYDYDSKTIGFYNEELPGGKRGKKISSILLNIFFAIVIIGFGFLGFYYGKKVYDKARKKRRNEIEDEYEYKLKTKFVKTNLMPVLREIRIIPWQLLVCCHVMMKVKI